MMSETSGLSGPDESFGIPEEPPFADYYEVSNAETADGYADTGLVPEDTQLSDEDFTEEDGKVAIRAWEVYDREITGAGLRWEFDGQPGEGKVDYIIGRGAQHLQEINQPGGLVARLQRFGGFVADVATFQGRPLTKTIEDMEPMTRKITADEVEDYRRFHGALVDYVGALVNYGPNSPEVAQAIVNAMQHVEPEAWREAGYSVPEEIKGYVVFGTNFYLSEVVNKVNSEWKKGE